MLFVVAHIVCDDFFVTLGFVVRFFVPIISQRKRMGYCVFYVDKSALVQVSLYLETWVLLCPRERERERERKRERALANLCFCMDTGV